MGTIEAICVSSKKGRIKNPIQEAEFRKDWGIVDDAHAGDWHRQVSLLAGESIDTVRKTIPTLADGAFAENIITRGIDIAALKIGDQLLLADTVVLEVTQIGKECHNAGCAIKRATGDCIMPKEGIFTKVVIGGTVRAGASILLKK